MALAPDAREDVQRRLREHGLVREEQGALRSTRRWQAAMARAAFRLYGTEDESDLRLPIAMACLELCGAELPDEELADMIEVMLPIEEDELDPRKHLARATG